MDEYDKLLSEYYSTEWKKASYILMIPFLLWLIIHPTLLCLQIKFNICRRVKRHSVPTDSEIAASILDRPEMATHLESKMDRLSSDDSEEKDKDSSSEGAVDEHQETTSKSSGSTLKQRKTK